ncbi:DgyrCDS13901 [Dimorphilus gyrociliatus]|uniref:DgyrCDS13901 n=1 Tax=Dimorphilus gyrociliatus TaxID=2664684 RepID=A0A7I8WC35_9ANNE|nr:DgyrCDS13901 [Dimorphilus gyrociliatus]
MHFMKIKRRRSCCRPLGVSCLLCSILIFEVIDYLAWGYTTFWIAEPLYKFNWPLDVDLVDVVNNVLEKNDPDVEILNRYDDLGLKASPEKCSSDIDLLFVVKSAFNNEDRRQVIRSTWGSSKFSGSYNLNIKTIFIVASSDNEVHNRKVLHESSIHKDIVLFSFKDRYWNNIYKVFGEYEWVAANCSETKHTFFADDDCFVCSLALFDYIQKSSRYNFNHLSIGYLRERNPCNRKALSAWQVTLREYPFQHYPPYFTGGSYIFSTKYVVRLAIGMRYTKFFRVDDAYIGIVAHKLRVPLKHSNRFIFYSRSYDPRVLRTMIASHQFADPSDPKGGKKLSKAEKEKLKKEEAERKAKEEEEQKLLAEKEEAERKEREALEAIERKKEENEERKRRKWQLEELAEVWDRNVQNLEEFARIARSKAKWQRYMSCEWPDPTLLPEINTYINLWREDKSSSNIDTVLADNKKCLNLIEELHTILRVTPENEIIEEQKEQYNQTIVELEEILMEKLEKATYNVFLESYKFIDSSSLNLERVIENNNLTLACWGNLAKNARIKSYNFEEIGFQFDIPKLKLDDNADWGIRILVTNYDHYSHHCKTFYPRIKPKAEPTIIEEEEKKEDESDEKEEGEAKADDENEQKVDREETLDLDQALKDLESGEGENKDEEKEEEEEKDKEDDMEEEPLQIPTPDIPDFEEFDGAEDVIDLRAFQILGGIYHFNLCQLPPQPRALQNCTLTKVSNPEELVYVPYKAHYEEPKEENGEEKKKNGVELEEQKKDEKLPLLITLTYIKTIANLHNKNSALRFLLSLPKNVYFCEEPQVARWNEKDKEWSVDGFYEHNFEEEERRLTFKSLSFGTFSLVQDAHINMPFQTWEIRPRDVNHVLITVIAAIIEVEIEVKNDCCALIAPSDKEELQELIGKFLPVDQFITRMKAAGLNLFPESDSYKYVSVPDKVSNYFFLSF